MGRGGSTAWSAAPRPSSWSRRKTHRERTSTPHSCLPTWKICRIITYWPIFMWNMCARSYTFLCPWRVTRWMTCPCWACQSTWDLHGARHASILSLEQTVKWKYQKIYCIITFKNVKNYFSIVAGRKGHLHIVVRRVRLREVHAGVPNQALADGGEGAVAAQQVLVVAAHQLALTAFWDKIIVMITI